MDALTHAVVGWAIAGEAGAAVAVAPDALHVAADVIQFFQPNNGLSIAEFSDKKRRAPPCSAALVCLGASDAIHSAWSLPLAFTGPLGLAWCSHIVLDWLTHFGSILLPPLGGVIYGVGPLREHSAITRGIAWIVAMAFIALRS